MKLNFAYVIVPLAIIAGTAMALWSPGEQAAIPRGRSEVVFWHFWGGADRAVVEDVVARFNASQQLYFVRAVAMPGNNLDLKFFLSVTGGDPPDLLNQDDPIVADWAARGALLPLEQLAAEEEIDTLNQWLYPAARRLGTYDGRLFVLCNGLDIRALYFNQTMLDQYGLSPPQTTNDLDLIAQRVQRRNAQGRQITLGYLPDPRRLWAWGVVFGGDFFDESSGTVTCDSPPIVRALDWMAGYRERFGADTVASFRQGDQSLPGKTFPLLAGRYAVVMDGQWRVRDINAHNQAERDAGQPVTRFGVCPLPPPPSGGRQQAGWVNGNFFVVPRGARNARGAWEFMKFWSGFGGHEAEAAATCTAGGWIPASPRVVSQQVFQTYLQHEPLLAQFVALAGSENQVPTPAIAGAPYYQKVVVSAAETAMYRNDSPNPAELLRETARRVQRKVDTLRDVP